MAVGHGRLLDRLPARVGTQPARHFAGEAGVGRHAEADVAKKRSTASATAATSAILAAPTFDDFWMTCITLSAPCGCASRMVRLPIVSCPGAVWMTCPARTMPASSAAAAVNGFSVEPGSNRSVTARLRVRFGSMLAAIVRVVGRADWPARGLRRSAHRARRCRPLSRDDPSPPSSAPGTRDTASRASIESVSFAPCCGSRMLSTSSMMWPRRSLITRRLPGLPVSVESNASSSASWPCRRYR